MTREEWKYTLLVLGQKYGPWIVVVLVIGGMLTGGYTYESPTKLHSPQCNTNAPAHRAPCRGVRAHTTAGENRHGDRKTSQALRRTRRGKYSR